MESRFLWENYCLVSLRQALWLKQQPLRQAECGERQIPTFNQKQLNNWTQKKTPWEEAWKRGGGRGEQAPNTNIMEWSRDGMQTHEDLISTLQDWDKLSLIQHLRLTEKREDRLQYNRQSDADAELHTSNSTRWHVTWGVRLLAVHTVYKTQETSFQLFSALCHSALTFSSHYIISSNQMKYFTSHVCRKPDKLTLAGDLCLLKRICSGLPLCVGRVPHAAVQSAETMHVERSCILYYWGRAFPSQLHTVPELRSQRDVLNRDNFLEENTSSKNSSHGDLSEWGKQSSLSSNNQAIQ